MPTIACRIGFYGENCDQPCSKTCLNDECEQSSGNCSQGCITSYYGPYCDVTCPTGCRDGCERNSGICKGCLIGWYNAKCTEKCPPNCNEDCDQFDGVCSICNKGWRGDKCDFKCSSHCNTGCDRKTGNCTDCITGYYGVKCQINCPPDCIQHNCNQLSGACESKILIPEGVVAGLISGAVVITLMFLIFLWSLIKRQRYLARRELLHKQTAKATDGIFGLDAEQFNTEENFANYKENWPWDSFQLSLLSRLSSGQLIEEYDSLSMESLHAPKAGLTNKNIHKNRYLVFLPYNHNRVVLQRSKYSRETDYINASYLKGWQKDKGYIVTQGPLEDTINDLWLMAWQEGVTQIIMLTNLQENGDDVSACYWPEPGKSHLYGNIVVKGEKETKRSDFIIREFIMTVNKAQLLSIFSLDRKVEHYQYVAWVDHSMPSATSFVNFWRYTKSRLNQKTIPIVQCSSGVERSGVYIALDIAMNQIENGHLDINVFKIVTELRKERRFMVASEAKYKFIHAAVFEAYTCRYTRFTFEAFDDEFPDPIDYTSPDNGIDSEFEVLKEMEKFVPPPFNRRSLNHIEKIRNSSNLPDDKNLMQLDEFNSEAYIFAVSVSSFRQSAKTIITQLPLPRTVVDFWRMVYTEDVNLIVSLGSRDEASTTVNYVNYFPKSQGELLNTGRYDISFVRSTELGHELKLFHVNAKTKDSAKSVRVLRYTNWADDVPVGTSDLISLVKTVNLCRSENEASPIIVQCIDGCNKSGLFCILSEIIDRAICDKEIDVFVAVRNVHTIVPQAITTEAQYRYCYKVAQDVTKESDDD